MKPQWIVKHGRLPALLAVVLVMSLGFTVVLGYSPLFVTNQVHKNFVVVAWCVLTLPV